MKTHSAQFMVGCLSVLAATLANIGADDTSTPPPSVLFQTGLAGQQVQLTWDAQPGARYRIRSTTDVTGAWRERAVVAADGPDGAWLDPEPTGVRAFYQIEIPQAQVFSVDPAVLSNGGTLILRGQCLPPGSLIVFEFEGSAPMSFPLQPTVPAEPGVYRISLNGLPPGQPVILSARIVTGGGAPVCDVLQSFEATTTGFASDSPPTMPLAAVYDVFHFDEATFSFAPAMHKATMEFMVEDFRYVVKQRAESPHKVNRVAGEICDSACDLELSTPAGPPLVLGRSYRSLAGAAAVGGTPGGIDCGNWCMSYDIRIEPVPLAAGANAPRVILHCDGRRDVLVKQADGSFVCDGMFRTGRFNPDTSFTLTFADNSQFIFCPLAGAPWRGRIGSIADRNGVALSCVYSPTGKLSTVSSQFGQSLTFSYDTSDRLSMVADHTGRFVSYAYYAVGEPGGPPGSLKSVSCPTIPGQAPVQGPMVYTYSSGFADFRLNGNLLSKTDGAGRLMAAWTYSSSTNPGDPDFDRCVTCDVHGAGPTSPPSFYSYEFVPASGSSGGGLLCIENDELGRVTEMRCDRMHRPVSVRCYTTFAAAGAPCTSTTNRPPAPPVGDAAFLEAQFSWNPDHSCTQVTEPDGAKTLVTYARELQRACPRRERGNARVVTLTCTDDSERPRVVSMEYAPGFGACETIKIPGVDHEFSSRPGGPGMRAGISTSRSNIRTRFLGSGGGSDGLSSGLLGFQIPEKVVMEKEMDFARSPGGRFRDDPCAEDAARTFCTSMTTAHGQKFTSTYDVHGNRLATTTPIAGSGLTCTYNTLGQLASVTTLNGPGSTFRNVCVYDPVTHFCSSVVCDQPLGGGGLQLTRIIHRDLAARITSVTDPRGFDTLISYDACDQMTSISSPQLGSARVVCTCAYDLGGLPVRCDFENRDATGAPVAANPHYTSFCVYDSRGHLTQVSTEQKPVFVPPSATAPDTLGLENFHVRNYTLDAAGQCVRVSTPAVCRGQADDAVCDMEINALGRVSAIITGGTGTPGAVRTEFSYTVYGQMKNSRTVAAVPADSPAISCTYDVWRRPASHIDEMGNVTSCSYEDTTGYTVLSFHGEVDDGPGGAGNVLLSKMRTNQPIVTKDVADITDASCMRKSRAKKRQLLPDPKFAVHPRTVLKEYFALGDKPTQADFVNLIDSLISKSEDGLTIIDDPTALRGVRLKKVIDGDDKIFTSRIIQDGNCEEAEFQAGMGDNLDRNLTIKEVKELADILKNEYATCGDIFTAGDITKHSRRRSKPAFFDVFVADETCVADRFTPNSAAPIVTETTTVHRSPAGLPLSISCNGDVLETYAYDSAGRLITVTNPGAQSVTCTLDACGNPTRTVLTALSTIPGTPAETFTTTAVFDGAGRCTSTSDSMGNSHALEFDSCSRCTRETLPGGLVVHHDFDTVSTLGEYSSVTHWSDYNSDSLPDVIVSSVCLAGRCVSTKDAFGHSTSFTCDAQCRPTRTDYPDGTFESTEYDQLGRSILSTLKDGTRVHAQFNPKELTVDKSRTNLPVGVTAVAPTQFAYNGRGDCISVSEGTSTVAFTYDSLGNLLSESQNAHTISHTYSHRGEIGVTYPDGSQFSSVLDAHGRMLSFSRVTVGGPVPVSTCEYSGFVCVKETRANGVVTTRDYRSDGEAPLPLAGGHQDFSFGECVRCTITAPNATVLEDQITRRNRDQFVTQEQRVFSSATAPPSRRMTYTLDGRNLVTGCITQIREIASGPVVTESNVQHALDARGQRVSTTGGSNPGAYTSSSLVPPADHQMAQYSTWPGGSLAWNDVGSLTHLSRGTGGLDLTYDALARLVQVNDHATGAPLANYAYDALSRRVSSTLPGGPVTPPTTTFFLYDGGTCIQELDGLGASLRSFACAQSSIICIIPINGDPIYPHSASSATSGARLKVWQLMQGQSPSSLSREARPAVGKPVLQGITRSSQSTRWTPLVPKPSMMTSSTGASLEHFANDDACRPIFLNADGRVRPAATSSLTDFRWLQSCCAWCPESSLFECPGGVYCPELGRAINHLKVGGAEHKNDWPQK